MLMCTILWILAGVYNGTYDFGISPSVPPQSQETWEQRQ